MKILIATGIFKPEIGGPATLAAELPKRLNATGHKAGVVTYSDKATYSFDKTFNFPLLRVVRGKNKFWNYFRYYRAVKKIGYDADVVYTLDWFSAGLPVMLACRSLKKRYVVRVGGGYLWEKYLSEGNTAVTLREFYEKGLYKKYWLMFWLIKKVLRNAFQVIFNSDEQKELYIKYYGLEEKRTVTIKNVVPENRISGLVKDYNAIGDNKDREIVFAGRFIKMKNVESLVEAFAKMKDESFRLLLIGDGPEKQNIEKKVWEMGIYERVDFIPPMSQSDLYKRIALSYLVVVPSWTDVSPHQAYECLSLGIPLLLTKENYLGLKTPNDWRTIDPKSVDDIADALNFLTDPATYKAFVEAQEKIKVHHTWDEVVGEHLKVFRNVLNQEI